MNKRNLTFFLFILSFLLIFSTVVSATDNFDDNSTNVQYSSTIDNDVDDMNKEIVKTSEKNAKSITMDSTNFDEYVTDRKFNENVSAGDTIDIVGKLDGSRFSLEVDKPVNIISSNGEAYIDCYTNTGHDNINLFKITKNGAGTNITGITFHNTRVSLENTSNVIMDNVKCLDEDRGIGQDVGAVSIREGSENITITNSYFKTRGNGGHSNVVFAAAYNCLFENNTIEAYGDHGGVGNCLYLTTYNVQTATPRTNINITIRNNKIRSYDCDSYAICYGLVLEGTGHVIENNIIDNAFPVMAQYADADYGFETNIDGIIFNNNTIIKGEAQLVFPGIVSNNTFMERALLKQVYAYGNKFNKVTIQNNVKFENNTANYVIIEGQDNILNNNEVYSSDEDYAVTINGENNTLENNKLVSFLGRGEKAINNSTEYTSLNNNENIQGIFHINDNNMDKYMEYVAKYADYEFTKFKFKDGDIVYINITPISPMVYFDTPSKTETITVIASNVAVYSKAKLILVNSTTPSKLNRYIYVKSDAKELTLINSIVGWTATTPTTVINSSVITPNYYTYPQDNTYLLVGSSYTSDTGIIELPNDSRLDVGQYSQYFGTATYTGYKDNIYFNRTLEIVGLPTFGLIDADVSFIEGSAGTTVTGVTFNRSLEVNEEYIKFNNCTFMGEVKVNNDLITFENCIFNDKITINASKNIVLDNNIINSTDTSVTVNNSGKVTIENNDITTASDNTIIFDEQSSGNTVKNNVLKAGSLIGDDSVIAGDNDVFDNSPSYNTSILIESDDLLFTNDVSTVNITVNNINTESPVDKGYVEVYLDGVLQGIKTLTDGKVSVEVNTNQSSIGDVPLKVWYYDGIRYANNVTTKTVNVAKSNVTINVDEFIAKLNEKAGTKLTFLNQKDNPVQDTNVTVTVGRTTYTVETVDGVATLDELVTTEWLDATRMTVTFPDTELYNRNSTTITLNTSKADVIITPTVTVEDNTASISLTLTDDLKQNVIDGKVTITTLDGTTLGEARVRNGKIETTVTLPDDYSDEYLVANFTGSYYYNDMVRNIKITTVLNSTITLETNSPLVGEELIINGKLTDSKNNPISKENIILDLNGTKVQLTTDEDGNYNYSYVPALGTSTITVTFNGNPDTYGTSTSKDVTIRDTDREMNEVLNRLDELQKENEKLLEQLEQLQEQLEQLREQNNKTADELNNITQQNNELKEQLDNQTGNLTAQNEALQEQLNNITQQNNATQEQLAALEEQNKELNDKLNNMTKDNEDLKEQLDNQTGNLTAQNEALQDQLDSINEQNEKLNDKLNDLLDLINQLNAPKDTVLTLDALDDAKYGDSITITGSLVDVGGNGVAGTVKLTINGGRATVVSDASGTFTYDYVVTRMGLNNIMATYMGTDKYNPSNTSATVNVVEQDTNIVLDNMDAIRSGDNVVVSGQLVDANGKGVYGTIKLTINNGRATVKTDADGFFKYEKALSKVGVNNITAVYVASAKYNACNVTGTVDVTALGTNIVLDDIASVRSGENITIRGKLLDENNKAIVGTIKLLINNGRATVKTNNNGEFTYTTSLTKVGSNNITVSYLGANRYSACNTTVSVDVSVMDTVLVIDDVVDAKKGDIISVSGKLADANGNAVVGTVKLTINGGRATVKTDNNGVFVYDYTVTKAGLTNVTASYLGANRYGASSATSTVDVAKLATKITFNPLDSVAQKTSMNITGQLSDENDNGIYGTVKLLINNGRATVKTDKAGAFTYTFTPSKVGDNTVTANYLESNNYEATETTTTFTVVKA